MGLKNLIEVIGAADRLPNLSRRDLLKLAAATATGAVTLADYGCAPFPKTTRQEVAKKKWDCNPILPMPPGDGMYIGTNRSGCYSAAQTTIADSFVEKYGKRPTFLAPGMGKVATFNAFFPDYLIESSHRAGAIPMIRYIVAPKGGWNRNNPLEGYKLINQGQRDEEIKIFGAKAAKLKEPIIVCPFQQPNDTQSDWRAWAGPGTAGPFKEAYVRIHDIWKKEGALNNVVMGVKLKVGRWQHWQFPDPLSYIPPKETVDSIGWCANNHCQPHEYTPSKSFEAILKQDYSRVVEKYPDIPQFIWELCCHEPCNQAEWYDDALTKIEQKYHWIKAVNLDECPDGLGSFQVNPVPNEQSTKVIRNHFANPRYIGNILPVKAA